VIARRAFVVTMATGLATTRGRAPAQGSGKTPHVGYVGTIAKFVAQGMDVIVASNPYALEAAVKTTRNISIVGLDLESDPVAKGWVAISGKQRQFLREAVPMIDRIAILGDPRVNDLQFKATETAAHSLRLTTQRLLVTSPDGIPATA
jgi:hypothetical protein